MRGWEEVAIEMIRGNETAIDLALDVIAATGLPYDLGVMAAHVEAARQVLGSKGGTFRRQDAYFLEQRALEKMRREARRRNIRISPRTNNQQ